MSKIDDEVHFRFNLQTALVFSAVCLISAMLVGFWAWHFYILLRVVVCGVAITVGSKMIKQPQFEKHAIAVFVIAVLFNPFILFELGRALWFPIDIVCAIYFIVLAQKINELKTKTLPSDCNQSESVLVPAQSAFKKIIPTRLPPAGVSAVICAGCGCNNNPSLVECHKCGKSLENGKLIKKRRNGCLVFFIALICSLLALIVLFFLALPLFPQFQTPWEIRTSDYIPQTPIHKQTGVVQQ